MHFKKKIATLSWTRQHPYRLVRIHGDLFYDTKGPPPTIENFMKGPTILREVEHAVSKRKFEKETWPGGILLEVITALEGLRYHQDNKCDEL